MRGRVPRAKLHPLQEELNTFHTHATRAQHGLSVSTRLASELRQTPEEDRLKTGVRKRLLPGRSVMSPGEQVSGDNEEAAERKRCNGQKAANHAPDQQARTPPASASIRLSPSARLAHSPICPVATTFWYLGCWLTVRHRMSSVCSR